MKYLVFSDAHNTSLEELKRIWSIAQKEKITEIMFLWDLDWMGFYNMKTLKEELEEIKINLSCILWNHDKSWYDFFSRKAIKFDRPSVIWKNEHEMLEIANEIKYSEKYKHIKTETIAYLESILNTKSILLHQWTLEMRHALKYGESISWTLWIKYGNLSASDFKKRFPSLFLHAELWYSTYGTWNDTITIEEFYWEKLLKYDEQVIKKNLCNKKITISGHEHHNVVFWNSENNIVYWLYRPYWEKNKLLHGQLQKVWAYEKWDYAILTTKEQDWSDDEEVTIEFYNTQNSK